MTPGGRRVVLVAAVARNGVIGDGADIPWHLPGEQARFKELTWGHPLLMGRATYDSIGRPLPGRTTVVLSRTPGWAAEGVLVASDLDAALGLVDDLPGTEALMVAGGAAVYAATLAVADEQVLTEVPLEPGGDVVYPAFDRAGWVEAAREEHPAYDVVTWRRRVPQHLVVMGVSGSGKSSVGRALADAVGAVYVEGDDLHPPANVAKMRAGTPLSDDDRWPWLDLVGAALRDADGPVVATCSALRRAYRDRIRATVPDAVFVHLDGDPDLLRARQSGREGHFMPASLMTSQLETLEPLGDDEAGVRLDVAEGIGTQVNRVETAF